MIFPKTYTNRIYFENEINFAKRFSSLTPKIISHKYPYAEWEFIDGNRPSEFEILKSISLFQGCQTLEDISLFKNFNYSCIYDILNYLESKIELSLNYDLNNSISKDRLVCHGDAHKDNFIIKHNKVYFIDTSFSCIASPFFDLAKVLYLNPSEVFFYAENSSSYIEIISEVLFRTLYDFYGIFYDYKNKGNYNLYLELIQTYSKEFNEYYNN